MVQIEQESIRNQKIPKSWIKKLAEMYPKIAIAATHVHKVLYSSNACGHSSALLDPNSLKNNPLKTPGSIKPPGPV